MSYVKIENLCVKYGDNIAVDDVSFEIPKGEVFGFIGPNGAGKTSTIKVLATLITPKHGKVSIDGINVLKNPYAIRKKIGYMPDVLGVYDDLNVLDYLHFFAAAYNITGEKRNTTVRDILELVDLTHKKECMVDDLSRGMKQRLSLGRVLLHDPDLLLLDEPASGLDPRARIEIREILKELTQMGKTIIISSHILQELAQMCTRIGIIEQGKLVAEGSLDEIYKNLALTRTIHVRLSNRTPEILAKIAKIAGVDSLDEQVDRLSIKLDENILTPENLCLRIQDAGGIIYMYQPEAMDMETVFMKLTEGITS